MNILPQAPSDIKGEMRQARTQAIACFNSKVISHEHAEVDAKLKELKESVRSAHDKIRVQNDTACTSACTEFLNTFHAEVMQSLSPE